MKGQIAKLKHKLSVLQNNDWIDNRTRALITEFSVYNPQVRNSFKFSKWKQLQVNLFGIVKIVGEFISGGIMPSYRLVICAFLVNNHHIIRIGNPDD